ncbi:SGNH/GDSL hydrolase family protein [Mucilaginibacter myungsuensis]|uniref:SGNH/GDSL hydrolase family protein n=1 Tax=Mucilaginibacter myungsuensis TaxID=649104 RepID=A0A929L5R4_9SPHI|nr:SGNH/GDSL hydrolase family protein [Mucilaginibacter myungsuensis]MBE9663706.1 SGNH/GDSL hydrolase family protein [Mucilaginibacter myungsuensis]MDN3598970.1 SGNH/GDSL hydrolase family protein [Mucilaginibacter myungsuensis]
MKRYFYLSFFLCILVGSSKGQSVKPFKAGDRIAFDGNSITDGGHYHSYIWLYYITRFPGMRIDIINSGIGGDVSKQIYERMDDDVFAHKPNVVAVTFGMNDTGYQKLEPAKADAVYAEKVKVSLEGFSLIEQKLKKFPAIRKIMIGSPAYDETSRSKNTAFTGKNKAIQNIIAVQQRAARTNGWDFVDFNQPLVDVNIQQQKTDSSFTLQGTDRIHPTNDGHMVMAYTFLKAQGLAGKKVAEVGIKIGQGDPTVSENCIVTDFKAEASGITYNYLAKALPYPLDTIARGGNAKRTQATALQFVPFSKEFNQEIVKVDGLKADVDYALKIDGKLIGKWKGADYKTGINLAEQILTPQYQQALAVMHLNEERWALERKLREYYWIHFSILKPKGMLYNDTEPIVDSLKKYAKRDIFVGFVVDNYLRSRLPEVRAVWRKELALLADQLYTINKPNTHRVQIVPAN